MDFFGVGPLELLMLLVVGLIVLGPERLPEVAVKTGRFIREFRLTYSRLAAEVMRELEEAERQPPPPAAEAEYRPSWSAPSPAPAGDRPAEASPAEPQNSPAVGAGSVAVPIPDTAPLGAPSTPVTEDGARRDEQETPAQ